MLLNDVRLAGYILGSLLHGFGLYLLWRIKNNENINATDWVTILNLSFTELLVCLFNTARFTLSLFKCKIPWQLTVSVYLTIALLFYWTMMLLTLNRFMLVYLNIKYHLYWSARKARVAVATFWIASILVGGLVGFHFNDNTTRFKIYIVFDLLFLLLLGFTNGYYIMKVYKINLASRRISSTTSQNVQITRKQLFKGLLAPCLIIITYVLFIIVPDMVYSYGKFIDARIISEDLELALGILRIFSYWSDAVIYILCLKPISNILKILFGCS